jgi:hypothetical protein
METLLITGSRNMHGHMREWVRRTVARAKENGWAVIVGDAGGVDAAVIQDCAELDVPCTVYGAYNKMRNRIPQSAIHFNIALLGTYPERDRHMTEKCSRCVGIWDGKSRGTRLTFSLVASRGLPVHVWHEAEGNWCSFNDLATAKSEP